MPARKKCKLLPIAVREELNRKLIEGSFSDFRGLEKWLKEQGFKISHTAVWEYSKDFEAKLEKIDFLTQQAKAICEASGDDENNLAEALTKLAQQKAFEQLLKIDMEKEDVKFISLVKTISDLNRSSVGIKKYRSEIRKQLQELTDDIAKENGLSDELAQQIREKILGVVS